MKLLEVETLSSFHSNLHIYKISLLRMSFKCIMLQWELFTTRIINYE